MIAKLFEIVKIEIEKKSHIVNSYNLIEKVYSEERGYIEGKIVFLDDSCLDFLEVINAGHSAKIKYRYHYMSDQNRLIFRYDNARHYPNIPSFPHHKHVKDTIEESKEPNIAGVLSEIERILLTLER
jgi:hypothetical protein